MSDPKHESVFVGKIPQCDLCSQPASVDGKTIHGPWAYMCTKHFRAIGVGLGLGRGQQLFLAPREAKP